MVIRELHFITIICCIQVEPFISLYLLIHVIELNYSVIQEKWSFNFIVCINK